MATRFVITDGDDRNVSPSPSPVYVTLLSVTTTVTNLCLGAVIISSIMFLHMFSASASMKQHVYLCVIGYVFIMAQAIQSLNPHSGWARLVKYQDRRVIHWMLQIVGSVLVIVGSIIRMMDVTSNFQSTHGILGLIAFICTVLSMIGGVANAYASRLNINPLYLKIAHSCLGSLTLSAAFLCLCFGLNTTFRRTMGNNNADIAIALTVCGLVGTLVSPCLDVIKRVSRHFSSD